MEYELIMSGYKLLENLQTHQCRERLIDYAKYLYSKLNRSLTKKDFTVKGRVSYETINRYFGTVTELLKQSSIRLEEDNIYKYEVDVTTIAKIRLGDIWNA